ncbi:hypothetical protein GGH93_001238 [Coemansia aciculifera]|nr:hypothetical protein GGH93_001238 [Coemansia aciculifera]
MYALTPLQFLPPHIIQLIVNHVVDSIRMRFYRGVAYSKKRERLLVPLLSVCHNFRNFVCLRFFRDCKLYLYAFDDKAGEAHVTWPSSPRVPAYPMYHLVKNLVIELCAWDVYAGAALRVLSVRPYDGVAFPLVKKLKVILCYSCGCEEFKGGDAGFPRNAAPNIGEFVRRVKQMAPAIGEVVISTQGGSMDPDGYEFVFFKDLFSRLFEIVKPTAFNDPCGEMSRFISMDQIRDLVRLTSHVDDLTVQLLQLTRRSAQTLQHLDIKSNHSTNVAGLITDPDSGEYAEYPRLRKLTLDLACMSRDIRKPVFNGAMPFPSPCQLYVGASYPFGDDVFFRGNSATLEYLSLALYQETVAILSTHCVFTPTSHPHLQYVNIIQPSRGTTNDFATPIAYLEYVMSIAPGASVRQIADMRSIRNGITPVLSVLGGYACIQVLLLYDTDLSLWNAISLIRSLPLLSDLTTSPPNLGELPRGVTTTVLPEHIRSNYAPMGERFRCWCIYLYHGRYTTEVATCVLLLALACPNFDYVAVDDPAAVEDPADDYGGETLLGVMSDIITKPGFSQYAPRLQRLLSDRQQ